MGDLDTFGDNGVLERYDTGLHMGVGLIAAKNAYVGFGYENWPEEHQQDRR